MLTRRRSTKLVSSTVKLNIRPIQATTFKTLSLDMQEDLEDLEDLTEVPVSMTEGDTLELTANSKFDKEESCVLIKLGSISRQQQHGLSLLEILPLVIFLRITFLSILIILTY